MTDRERAIARLAYQSGWAAAAQAARDGASDESMRVRWLDYEARVLSRAHPNLRLIEGALSAEK